jgi:hypothetical protein
MIQGLPPADAFPGRLNKQSIGVPFEWGPQYSQRVWDSVAQVVETGIVPAVVDKFRAALDAWFRENLPLPDGTMRPDVRFLYTNGRILLRRRGYVIPPHRDPKWGFLTCLLYLPRPSDSEKWGTQLYSVTDDVEASNVRPHWIRPEQCRLERDIPFRRNSMLVMMNFMGAHGAFIPEDAEPADLERYAYQFRISPSAQDIDELMRDMPDERRAMWTGKAVDYA